MIGKSFSSNHKDSVCKKEEMLLHAGSFALIDNELRGLCATCILVI
jgi:hypothetical protein